VIYNFYSSSVNGPLGCSIQGRWNCWSMDHARNERGNYNNSRRKIL